MLTGPELLGAQPDDTRYIETYTGRKFFLAQPDFAPEDIAAATSKQCRFTGHTRRFYSVAEHQILVADIMEYLSLGDSFEGLNHDDTEAYLADISSPWKPLLPDYKRVESDLDRKVRAWLGLPLSMTEGCKRADWIALFIEAFSLIPSKGDGRVAPPGVYSTARELVSRFRIYNYTPDQAQEEWLTRFYAQSAARESVAS